MATTIGPTVTVEAAALALCRLIDSHWKDDGWEVAFTPEQETLREALEEAGLIVPRTPEVRT